MARLNKIVNVVLLLTVCTTGYLDGFSFDRVKQAADPAILRRIQMVGSLLFNDTVMPLATEHRKFACFFVFDKEASADLNNNIENANQYANQLATLTSKYTAHANIEVTNAGTEIWADNDRISFSLERDIYSAMSDVVTQFQAYLNNTQYTSFGTVYAVGVLISKKSIVQGGYSQGPACTTFAVSLINYRQIPWSIAGLLAHELAHTLSVVHPFELSYLCQSNITTLDFCHTPESLPLECTCDSIDFPPSQCLMTFQFGQATKYAPTFTSCDIKMMKYFSSNISCLIQ